MSPEQNAGLPHVIQADTWQLACLLVDLRAGMGPLPALAQQEQRPAAPTSKEDSAYDFLSKRIRQLLLAEEMGSLQRCMVEDWRLRPTVTQLLIEDPYLRFGAGAKAG